MGTHSLRFEEKQEKKISKKKKKKKKIKKIKKIIIKFSIFTDEKNLCILHGHVFVMSSCLLYLPPCCTLLFMLPLFDYLVGKELVISLFIHVFKVIL